MAYKVTYEKNGVQGAYPGVTPKQAVELARKHQGAGDVPVKIFDDAGARVDLHALEMAVRGTKFG